MKILDTNIWIFGTLRTPSLLGFPGSALETNQQYVFRVHGVVSPMAERESARISRDIMSEPHVDGRRVSVRQIAELVEEKGEEPATVADRFDLDVADLYHALAYYHDHPREMQEIASERAEVFESFKESIDRPEGVNPDTA